MGLDVGDAVIAAVRAGTVVRHEKAKGAEAGCESAIKGGGTMRGGGGRSQARDVHAVVDGADGVVNRCTEVTSA
jgi:hypothetical protein